MLDQIIKKSFLKRFLNPIRNMERKTTLFGTTVYQAMKMLKRVEYNSKTDET